MIIEKVKLLSKLRLEIMEELTKFEKILVKRLNIDYDYSEIDIVDDNHFTLTFFKEDSFLINYKSDFIKVPFALLDNKEECIKYIIKRREEQEKLTKSIDIEKELKI